MKVVGMKWGLVREAACTGTGFHPTGNPAGRVYQARLLPSRVLLARVRGVMLWKQVETQLE